MIVAWLVGCGGEEIEKEEEVEQGIEDSGDITVPESDADGFDEEAGDCDDDDATVYPEAPELCDGKDNDCDGDVDDGATSTWYLDADGDGYGDPATAYEACEGEVSVADDCDDTRPDVFPGAEEACDGADGDCDGQVDEDGRSSWYTDLDGDGYGDPSTGESDCAAEGRVADGTDCADADATVNPGAAEVCDGEDQDCDGYADDGVEITVFADADEDGFGDPANPYLACEGVADATDCDDARADVYPGGVEVCDGVDQSCDGVVDEGVTSTWYGDGDGDGHGDPASATDACTGELADADDCDDTRADVFPGAVEVCDGVDQDCDGTADEGVQGTWYDDADGDGYGDPASGYLACAGGVADATDCDDTDAASHPGAAEVYDGADNDCDGDVDDDLWVGTGADGALVVTGTTLLTGAWAVTAISGSDVTLSAAPTGLAAGDEVLLVNLHGSDAAHAAAGTYEFAIVDAVAGAVVTLEDPVAEVYGEASNASLSGQAVQLVRVGQYTDVTVSGTLTTSAWDGSTGGIVAFRATGTVSVSAGGAISADALGYLGGATGTAANRDGYQGESYAGTGDGNQPYTSGYNLGNGAWVNNYGGGGALVTGGGGEHAGGATAGDSWSGTVTAPEAGDTYGDADLATIFFGSGGGGVWRDTATSTTAGPGGDGGGVVFIGAGLIETAGAAAITALGETATAWSTGSWTYGAGGGAGGTIWLVADRVDLVSGAIDAGGGFGESAHTRDGGDGGEGRVRIDTNTVSGATLDDACDPDAGYEGTP